MGAAVSPRAAASPNPYLATGALKNVLDQAPTPAAATQLVAEHIALHSPITIDYAQVLAESAVTSSGGDNQAAAEKLASTVPPISPSLQLKLSNPNPLSVLYRTLAAGATLAIMIAAVVLVAVAHSQGQAEYVTLGILGGLAWLGAVLFVMGYQSVDLEGSSGSGASGSA
jgi:hypothetical protein